MILRWERVRLYWPHSVLIVLVFVIHIQDWWATYALRNNTTWHLPMFLFIILYPVNLYILARILFPLRWSPLPFDLKIFYLDNFRKIYLFLVILPVHSLIENCLIREYAIQTQALQLVLIVMLTTVIIINRKDEWIHKTLAAIFIALCILTMIIGWEEFTITA